MLLSSQTVRRTLAALLAAVMPSAAAPIALNDNYPVLEDTPLNVPASGLMSNDNPNGTPGALAAVKVGDPVNGTVTVNADGSFLYTPGQNFFGQDSFTYKIVSSAGPVAFTIDQNNSVLNVRAQTTVAATGVSDDQTTTAKAKGSITAALTPTQSPFGTAQIRTMNMALAEQASLTVCVAKLFGGCIGWLTARIDADGLVISMREDQAGPAVSVAANGVFNQTGNRVDAVGTMNLTTSGAASVITVPPTAELNSQNLSYDFNGATITQIGSTLHLSVPLNLVQTIDEADYDATVTVSGTIRATAPVPAAPPESNVATVSIDVVSVDDAPVSISDRYYTRQNHTLNIPAAGSVPVNETLIAGNSTWKYRTGADLGTGWRAVNFDDSIWATATGVLGYGDADILASGTIPARANMGAAASAANPNYPTAYFRKEFTLTAPSATLEARVEVQRDDACVLFVNGTEVYRDSTAYTTGGTAPLAATGEIDYASYAAAGMTPDTDGAVYKVIPIPANLFREGKNVIAAMVKQQGNTSSDLRFDLKCFRSSQPTQQLLAGGSVWKYSTGADLGTAWRTAEYNDSAWISGPALLGYGDPDIVTSIPVSDPGGQKYPTAYFRASFQLADPYNTVQPRVEVQRDDACAIYVNGTEIYRDSTPFTAGGPAPLPAGGEIPYSTYAAASNPDEAGYKTVSFSRSLLREGRNVIAVEVHQNGNSSTDLRFDLRAFRTTGVGGVAANDTDVDGPAFNVVIHSAPANGFLALQPDGSFTYTPAPGFPANGASGTDSFVYAHRDAFGLTFNSAATVSPMAASWKYLDTGVAAPQDAGITAADWRNAAFDDAAWKTGSGEFGYGDGGEGTVIEDDATPGSPTSGSTTRYITSYFRRKFTYEGSAALLSTLTARVIRDDGVVVWLNGHRIVWDNMPGEWDANTPALGAIGGGDETTPVEVTAIPGSYLLEGENILAVEIHQADATSSDVSFDMELIAESVAGGRAEIIVLNDDLDSDNMSDTWERANLVDASTANAGDDDDGDGQTNRAEFLAGTHPRDGSSAFRTTSLTPGNGNQLQLTFQSVPGKTYTIQYSDSLGSWQSAGGPVAAHPSASTTTTTVVRPAGVSRRFYRAFVIGDWD